MEGSTISRLTAFAAALLLLTAACSAPETPPSHRSLSDTFRAGSTSSRDYAAIQRERAARMEAAAEAFRTARGDLLFTTPEEVITRHLDAIGGREALDTIQTMVMRLSVHGAMGHYADLIRYYRRPMHYRQESVGSGRASVTDGSHLWQVGPDGWTEMGQATNLRLASIDGFFIDYEAWGVSYELRGVMALDGDPGYRLRRTWPDGSHEDLFFSAGSGLLTAVQSEYTIHPASWFSYWDYRDLGGVRLPHVMIRSIGDLGPPHGAVVESVAINVALPDSLFLPPGGG